ncbi:secernin-2-like [Nematolebias whitei]|uniref:secernin-2-like n=1 Tax=Nematolebias whitei TaxID=451745 RepID=UPI00189972AE|nr:secernin-2-like [Nematolebias whitei]
MMSILRDKPSGICMDSGGFRTTGSMVSVLPRDSSLPCVHFFTATPDPSRSIFKPFIFSDTSAPVPRVVSPQFGPDDPVRKQPRFHSRMDRRHDLYKAHQGALIATETKPDEGSAVYNVLRDLESQCLSEISAVLSGEIPGDDLGDLFFDCVDTEIKFYQ